MIVRSILQYLEPIANVFLPLIKSASSWRRSQGDDHEEECEEQASVLRWLGQATSMAQVVQEAGRAYACMIEREEGDSHKQRTAT